MNLRVESGLDIGSNHPFYPSYMIKGKCLRAPLISTRSKYEKIYVLRYFLSFYLVQWSFGFVRVGEVKHGLVTQFYLLYSSQLSHSFVAFCCYLQTRKFLFDLWGSMVQWLAYLLLDPAAPGSIPSVPRRKN